MKYPLAAMLVFLFLSQSAWSQVLPFIVEYSGQAVSSESNSQFETSLLHAYQFVTQRVADKEDRKRCPIRIKFKNLNGRNTGFTPISTRPCSSEIYLDPSLERNWQAQVVFAHELTHILRHQHNPREELWLDEGIAKLMEILYGGLWPTPLQDQLQKLKSFSLSDNPANYYLNGEGYVTAYFLLQYLYNRLGQDALLKELITSTSSGWASIETAALKLTAQGIVTIPPEYLSRSELWLHFGFSLLLNDRYFASYGLFFLDDQYEPLVSVASVPLLPDCENNNLPSSSWTIRYCDLKSLHFKVEDRTPLSSGLANRNDVYAAGFDSRGELKAINEISTLVNFKKLNRFPLVRLVEVTTNGKIH